MKFDKPKIKKILSGIIDSHDIININHFDKEIIIDNKNYKIFKNFT